MYVVRLRIGFFMGLKAVRLLQQTGKGITVSADDVARYAKACGKRSILETKPILAKINPNELRFADDILGKLVSSKKTTFNEIAKKFTSEWGRNFTPDEIKNITTKYNIDANDLVDIIACNRPMEEGNNMKIFNEFFNIMDSKSPTLTHRIQGIKKSVLSLPRNIIKSFKNAWTLFLFKIRK